MTGFGTNPTTTNQGTLSANQFPVSSVAVPGHANGDLTALEGGPESTDGNGNKTAPASIYIKDGSDVTKGTQADAAWGGSGSGSEIAILKKLVALLTAALTVSGTVTVNAGTNLNTSALALETGGNLALAKTDLDAINAAIGSISDTTWSGSGNGSEIAILKKIVAELAATLTVSGTVTANAGTGTMTVGQATGSNLHTVIDSGTVTVNAGTNLNTSALAVETGGNLSTLVTNTNKIPASSVSGTLQLSQTTSGNGSTLNILGMGSATFTVNTSGFTGTINFEGSGDGTNYGPITCNQVGTNTFVTTVNSSSSTSIQLFSCSVASLQLIRARTSSVSAGTITITVEAVPAPWAFTGINATNILDGPSGLYSVGVTNTNQLKTSSTLIDGVGGTNVAGVDSSNRLKTVVSSALPAGTNVIGHIIADTGSTTAVTSLPAIPSGTNLMGGVQIVDSGGTNKVAIDAAGNQQVKGGFTEQSSLTAASLNADLVPSTDVSAYKSFSLTLNSNAYSGTLSFAVSNDNITFTSLEVFNAGSGAAATTTSGTSITYVGHLAYRYFRVRMTSYTSGAAQATLELYTSPLAPLAIFAVQAGTWTVQPGNTPNTTPWLTNIQVGGTAPGLDNTNELKTSLYGKSTAAGDTAIKVNSVGDQYVVGDFTEQASLSAGSLNADLVTSTDVSAYKLISLQVGQSSLSGTLTFQASNDGATWFSVQAFYSTQVSGTGFTSIGNAGATNLHYIPVWFRYFRCRMTSYTSGNASGTLELYTQAVPYSLTAVAASQQGTWTINAQVATTGGSSDYHLISAATTNAANIKSSAGQVYGYDIYNSNAAARYVKLYNKASAPTVGTDTPFRTIGVPPSGRASFHSSVGLVMGTGISIATTTGIADADNTAVGLSDLSIDIDYK